MLDAGDERLCGVALRTLIVPAQIASVLMDGVLSRNAETRMNVLTTTTRFVTAAPASNVMEEAAQRSNPIVSMTIALNVEGMMIVLMELRPPIPTALTIRA